MTSEPLKPGVERVGFVVHGQGDYYAPDVGRRQLRLLPDLSTGHLGLGQFGLADLAITGSGRHLLFFREALLADEGLPLVERRRLGSVCRYTFATGEMRQLNFSATSNPAGTLVLAGSPDGEQVAVAQTEPYPDPGRNGGKLTLWLARWDGSPALLVHTAHGGTGNSPDDVALQWDPTGRRLAGEVLHRPDATTLRPEIVIFDTATRAIVHRRDQARLVGSASFDATGQRLLVEDDDTQRLIKIVDLTTGWTEQLPLHPFGRPHVESPGAQRVLGFSGTDHIIYAVRRGTSMTLHRSEFDGASPTPVVRWRLGPDMYPIINAAFWDTLAPFAGAT